MAVFSKSRKKKGFFLCLIRLNLDERKPSFVHTESTNMSQAISRYACLPESLTTTSKPVSALEKEGSAIKCCAFCAFLPDLRKMYIIYTVNCHLKIPNNGCTKFNEAGMVNLKDQRCVFYISCLSTCWRQVAQHLGSRTM